MTSLPILLKYLGYKGKKIGRKNEGTEKARKKKSGKERKENEAENWHLRTYVKDVI
jgi:hypothetical protein